jgi:hypothetical protein
MREYLEAVARTVNRLDGELEALGYGDRDKERRARMKVMAWDAVVGLKNFILSLDRSK